MDLSQKLRRFVSGPEHMQKRGQTADLRFLGGKEMANPFGSYYLVEHCYGLDYGHGRFTLACILAVDWDRMAFVAKDEAVQNIELDKTIFLDTEATGLSGGAGTYVFLVGVGFVQAGTVIVRQYLMRDYHEEAAMLFDLYQLIKQFDAIVTFNGKCFDWPLLRDRFTLARFEPLRKNYIHLDLLHAARRLWRDSLPSCSLDSLEAFVLKVARERDIPGSEIPQRYFDFIRTGRGELLVDILEHNQADVLSLVTLVGSLNLAVGKPAVEIKSDSLCLALARLSIQHRQWHRAIEFLQRGISLARSNKTRCSACTQLALIYRRLSLWEQAEEIWLMLAEEHGDVQACEELAKYYEHVCRDFTRAKTLAKRGLALALAREPSRTAAFEYRLDRLDRKLARLEQQSLQVN
ncbi:MAG: ribonuclease H-like domain-containing protein [Firmicutes bacterium]|jgi:uncharacterized protein YprB with RNaseH-like and TPR domain|nr:ribonuclease H-like domain-containing protein [Bacillota bacterium]